MEQGAEMSLALIASILGTIDAGIHCLKNMAHVLGMAQTVFNKSTWMMGVPLRSLRIYTAEHLCLCCICPAVELQF